MNKKVWTNSECFGEEQLKIMNLFRKLWEQHVYWTRAFIVSAVGELKDLDAVTQRLLRNPTDFADVLKRYYGDEKAREFERLLREHLLLAADLLKAAKAGNKEAADTARGKWYRNAEDIARFLSRINPYWSEGQWKVMLFDHLRMVEEIATMQLTGQYAAAAEVNDRNEERALMMADYMSAGLLKQFGI